MLVGNFPLIQDQHQLKTTCPTFEQARREKYCTVDVVFRTTKPVTYEEHSGRLRHVVRANEIILKKKGWSFY